MGDLNGFANNAVSSHCGGTPRGALIGARVFARSVLAAASVSLLSTLAFQGWSIWESWRGAEPVRISLGALQAVSQIRFQLGAVEFPVQEIRVARVAVNPPSINRAKRAPVVQLARPVAVHGHAKSESLATQTLLLRLARNNAERVVRLWMADPIELPARQVPQLKRQVASVQRTPARILQTAKKPERVVDRVMTHSASPERVTIQPRSERLVATQAPLPAPIVAPVASAPPQLSVQEPAAPLPEKVVLKAATPPAPAVLLTAPESNPGRLSRLTRDSRGEAWLISSSPTAPAVLMAQANSVVPHHLKAHQLSSQSGVSTQGPQQSELGWLSGWLPEGTGLRAKGAGSIAYYGPDGQRVGVEAPGEKFFVASRVPAGAAIAQMVRLQDDAVVSAVGVPVLGATATQLDFRSAKPARLRGFLWSSESSQPKGVAHAEVRLVGFPNHLTITANDGSFDLGEVELPSGVTAFVEARLPGGFTHRYSIPVAQTGKPLSLFLFSDQRVHGWLSSLEGGVSAESGLVVASSRGSASAASRPVIKALAQTSRTAETYWLDAEDRLIDPAVAAPTEDGYVRWVGVEVSSRSVLAGLQSARGRWLEASWIPVSAGVISVLSPVE